jgi:hypothetical protein
LPGRNSAIRKNLPREKGPPGSEAGKLARWAPGHVSLQALPGLFAGALWALFGRAPGHDMDPESARSFGFTWLLVALKVSRDLSRIPGNF